MEKYCVIISGGEETAVSLPAADAFVIACDKGYEYARRQNISVDLIVGDFDSAERPCKESAELLVYPSEKDDTDTMIAVRRALNDGFTDIRIFCALGGRADHSLANMQSAAFAAKNGARVTLCGRECTMYFINNTSLSLPRIQKHSLSVFAFSDTCSGVTLKGTKYTLSDADICNTFPIGVSNEWVKDTAHVSVKDGVLAVAVCRM